MSSSEKDDHEPTSRGPGSPGSPGSHRDTASADPSSPNPPSGFAAHVINTSPTHPHTPTHTLPRPSPHPAPHPQPESTTSTAQSTAEATAHSAAQVDPADTGVDADPEAATGTSSAPVTTSTNPLSSEISELQRTELDGELQRRLLPQASLRTIRRQALELNNWDLTAAHAQYTRVLAQVMQGTLPAGTLPPGVIGPTTSDATLFHAMQARDLRRLLSPTSTEEQRRRIANEFHRQLNIGRTNQIRLAVTEAILLLNMNSFDIDEAIDAFESQEVLLAKLHAEFDRFRPGLGSDHIVKNPGPAQERQDESLAHLASITGRSDWYSLQRHLIQHHWNLVTAVETWYKSGISVVAKVPKTITHKYRRDYKLEPLSGPSPDSTKPSNAVGGWRPERNDFMSKQDYANGLAKGTFRSKEEPLRQNEKARKGVPFAFAIDSNRERILPGPPDPKRFIFEFFRKGVLKVDRFTSKKFFFPELGGTRQPDDPPNFDWNDPDHIFELNKWLKQVTRRATGVLTREPSQTWTEAEKKFLYDLHMERLNQLKEKHKGQNKSEDELLAMDYGAACLDGWADRFNQQYPRDHARNGRAIDTMRRRIPALVKRFKLKPDRNWLQLNKKEEEENKSEKEKKDEGKSDADDGQSGSKRKRDNEDADTVSEEERSSAKKKKKDEDGDDDGAGAGA